MRQDQRIWLAAICLAGGALRFYRLSEPQLWVDELLQLIHFSEGTLRANLTTLSQQVAATPLDYWIQSLFVGIWGPWEFGARFHAALFGTLSLPCFFALLRRLLGTFEALIATGLLALYPLHVFYSREGRNYSLYTFLTILSLLCLVLALQKGGWRAWALSGFVDLLLLYTNYLASLVLATKILCVVALSVFPRFSQRLQLDVGRRALVSFSASTASAFALFLPWALWTIGQARFDASEAFLSFRFLLRLWRELSGGSSPLSLLLTLLTLIGLASLWKTKRRGAMLLLAAWFTIPVFGALLLDWLRGYFFAIRQVLCATPAILALSSQGAVGLHPRRRVLAGVLSLAGALSLATIALSDRKEHADWKGLVSNLRLEKTRRASIVAPEIQSIVSFRCPECKERITSLESLMSQLDGAAIVGQPAGVVLVRSRFLAPRHRLEIDSIIERFSPQLLDSLNGFEVYLVN